jgi:hypothetical protein
MQPQPGLESLKIEKGETLILDGSFICAVCAWFAEPAA